MGNMYRMRHLVGLHVLLGALIAGSVSFPFVSAARGANGDDYIGPTPPRLSLIEGQVSYWPAGASAWEAAPLNLPLAPGDYLAAGAGGRFELQVGVQSFLRGDADSEVGLEFLDERRLRFEVVRGRVTLDVRSDDLGASLEVASAHGVLTVAAPGTFDLRIDADRGRFTAYDGGSATLRTASGSMLLVAGSEIVAGAAFAQPLRYDAPSEDDWLLWGRERSGRVLAAPSRAYVADGVYGAHDLDSNGTWYEEQEYGRIWVPLRVSAGWAPYTVGRWVYSGHYGWSWVDAAPWGWAPFHHGRWVRWRSRWAWAPGPVYVRPVYAPALVAFLSPPVGVFIGVDPVVSWVTLGWGEPVIPWWGPTWYRGRPCWTGWGGPTIVHNVHVHRNDWRHRHRDIRRYRHQEVPDAVRVVHRRDFESPRPSRLRLDPAQTSRFRPGGDGVPPPSRPRGRGDEVARMRPSRPAPGQRERERGSDARSPQAVERRLPAPRPMLEGDAPRVRPHDLDGREERRRERPDRDVSEAERQRAPRPQAPAAGTSPRPRIDRGAPGPMAPPPAAVPRQPERERERRDVRPGGGYGSVREQVPSQRPLPDRPPRQSEPRQPRLNAPAMQAPEMQPQRPERQRQTGQPRQPAPAQREMGQPRQSAPSRPEARPRRDREERQEMRPPTNRERVRSFMREQRGSAGDRGGASRGEPVSPP
jgi:hypothetical protein